MAATLPLLTHYMHAPLCPCSLCFPALPGVGQDEEDYDFIGRSPRFTEKSLASKHFAEASRMQMLLDAWASSEQNTAVVR